MALAAKDIALAGIASFVAWGYATHWFPALRFAGHGVVVGVLLTVGGLLALVVTSIRGPLYGGWKSPRSTVLIRPTASGRGPTSKLTRSLTTALLVDPPPRRGAAFTGPKLWPTERAVLRHRQDDYRPLALYPPSPRVSQALDGFVHQIIQSFVRSWYASISPHDSIFPNEVDGAIRLALVGLRDRLLAVDDVAAVLTSRLVPILTNHFHDFNEAERAVRGHKLNRSVTESDELDLAIASKYHAVSPLHPAAQLSYSDTTTRLAQQDYLRRLTGNRLLPRLLPPSFLASRPVATLVREIVACAVLAPLFQILAEPDTWNQIVENYGRTVLQDRSTVRKLRAALDQHTSPVPGSSLSPTKGGSGGRPAPAFPRLAPGDSERRFERFVRIIRKVNNLSDARRFRSEVASQLRKDADSIYTSTSDGTAGGGAANNGNTGNNSGSPEVQQTYLRRLEMGKHLLDQRVQFLAAGGDSRSRRLLHTSSGLGGGGSGGGSGGGNGADMGMGGGPASLGNGTGSVAGQTPTVSRLESASLGELLRDAAGLSYFMEYMDRQRMLPLVQFWLVVDGFRNPLEEVDEDDDNNGSENDPLPSSLPPWTDSDRLDLAQIDQAYLSRRELHIPEASRRSVGVFLEAGRAATPEQYYRARRAILRCQAAVLAEMKTKHFQSFKKSDLFYKCLAAEEASQKNSMAAAAKAQAAQAASNHTRNNSTATPSFLVSSDNSRSSLSLDRPPSLPPMNRKSMSGPSVSTQPAAAAPPQKTGGARLLPKLQEKLRKSDRSGSVPDIRTTANATPTTATTTTNATGMNGSHSGNRNGTSNGNANFESLFGPPSPQSDTMRQSLDDRSSAVLFGEEADLFSKPTPPFSSSSNNNNAASDHDALADSVQSLDMPDPQDQGPDNKVVQAVEEALTNIMEDDRPTTAEDLRASLFGSDDGLAGSSLFADNASTSSARGSMDIQRQNSTPLLPGSHPQGQDQGQTQETSAKALPKGQSKLSHASQHASLMGKDTSKDSGGDKPSLSSLGLVSAYSRIGVFEDDDLFGDDQAKYLSDGEEDGEGEGTDDPVIASAGGADAEDDEVQAAAPGDLGLAEAITALTDDTDRLVAQEAVVDSLLKKAELTNNTAELRILRKSKASLQREIRRKELQRQQYIIQESDHSLYGRASVRLTAIQVGHDDRHGGKEYAVYSIEVRRRSGEKPTAENAATTNEEEAPVAVWAVSRRYSEFWALHQRLRARYPSVRTLDFPRRHVVMKLQNDFLQKRRAALERYLRALLLLPDVCRSRDLRAFLSQRVILGGSATENDTEGNVISRLYDSVADGMEDFLGSIPVLDQLSVAGQNLIAAATSQQRQGDERRADGGPPHGESAEAAAELAAFAAAGGGGAAGEDDEEEAAAAPFVKPICDIFLEVFELNRGNNWLRGRAVVVVLHQLLGGTIERKLRENVRTLIQDEALLRYIGMVQGAVFGQPPAEPEPAGVAPTSKSVSFQGTSKKGSDKGSDKGSEKGSQKASEKGPEKVFEKGGENKDKPAEQLQKGPPRTNAQKARTRTEAGLMLATLIPDMAGGVVGRVNAQAASRRIFATFNNQRLNAHLAFTFLDVIVDVLFGEEQ